MGQVKVVARFMNSELLKGYTNDFFQKKPSFHVGSDPLGRGIEVVVKDLKALFFVKDFEGNPAHETKQSFDEKGVYQGKKAEVIFVDGEKISGTVLSYDKERPGFFIVPADEECNNTRAFIVSASMKELKFL